LQESGGRIRPLQLLRCPQRQAPAHRDFHALWICPTDGGEPRKILGLENPQDVLARGEGFSERIRWRVAWTPDSRYLLFLKVEQAGLELWRIEAEGGKAEFIDTLLAKRAGDGTDLFRRTLLMRTYALRVHPDGRRVAFVAPGSFFEQAQQSPKRKALPADAARGDDP
jgi:hypothetical protein